VLLGALLTALSCQKKPILDQNSASNTKVALTAVSSPKNLVHRKRANVLNNILFKALDLPDKKAVCTELGKKKLQCADVVHRVALGSMEAYDNTMYQHPEGVSLTSPIALDRLVLAACATRAGRDFAKLRNNVISDQAVIFKHVKFTSDLRLVLNEAIDQSIVRLYQRGLTRDPTPSETQAIKDLYQQVFDENPIGAAINWMTLSCFVVFTSIEGAFY
jgi:hypothetical protein